MVAEAFALPRLFFFELAKASMFIAIGVMVFCGENRISYMLGTIVPPLWLLLDFVTGGLISDFRALFAYLGLRNYSPGTTPLDGFARLAAIFLFVASLQAWRKEARRPLWAGAFWLCLVVCLAYVGALNLWHSPSFPAMP